MLSSRKKLRLVDLASLLAFIALSVFSLRAFFKDDAPVAFHDLSPIYRFDQLFRPFAFPWDHLSAPGSPNLLINNLIYNLPLVILSTFPGSVILAHKIQLVIMMALSGFGFYVLFTHLTGSRVGGLVAGLYSMMNPFTLSRWVFGHNTLLLAYAILPFALDLHLRSIRVPTIKSVLSCSVLVALMFLIGPHIAYLFFVVALIFSLHHALFGTGFVSIRGRIRAVIISLDAKQSKNALFAVLRFVSLLAGFSVLVLPILYYHRRIPAPVFSIREDEVMLHSHVWSVMGNPVTFSIIPLAFVIIWFLSVRRPLRYGIIFLLLGIAGVLLALGGSDPWRQFYLPLFSTVPGLNIFRETDKFILLPSLSSSFFIGSVAAVLDHKLQFRSTLRKIHRFLSPLLVLSIVGILVFASTPAFLTGDMGGKVSTVMMPEEYRTVDNLLIADTGNHRVAYFPPANGWFFRYQWSPIWFLDPIGSLPSKPTIEVKSDNDVSSSADFVRWAYTYAYSGKVPEVGRLLGLLGVKYAILRQDIDPISNTRGFEAFTSETSKDVLNGDRGLWLERKVGGLTIYRNPNYLPRLFQAEDTTILVGDRSLLVNMIQSGFPFGRAPGVFLEDLPSIRNIRKGSHVALGKDAYWDLITYFGRPDSLLLWPAEYSSLSTDPTKVWVNGKLTWYVEGGSLSVSPSYTYTIGKNTLELPVIIKSDARYKVLIKTFEGLPGSKGLTLNFRPSGETFVQEPRGGKGYSWSDLGSVYLFNGRYTLNIYNHGGPAAVSHIALVSEEKIGLMETEIQNSLRRQDMRVMYSFGYDSLTVNQDRYSSDRRAANGMAILQKQEWSTVQFYVFKAGEYHPGLRIIGGDEVRPDDLIVILGNRTIKPIAMSKAGSYWELEFEPTGLTEGWTQIKIKASETKEILIDMLFMIDTEENRFLRNNGPLISERDPGKEITLTSNAVLSFLDAYPEFWSLSGASGEIAPQRAFGFASTFIVQKEGNYKLFYLGERYLTEGTVISILLFIGLVSILMFMRHRNHVYTDVRESI